VTWRRKKREGGEGKTSEHEAVSPFSLRKYILLMAIEIGKREKKGEGRRKK